MRILPPVEEEIRRTIRDARAKDPLINVAALQDVLEKRLNRRFTHQYVSKIADKVMRDALISADRTKLEQRLNFTRENYRLMRQRMLDIIYWQFDPDGPAFQKPPLNKDVIEAAKNLVMLDLALLNAELSAGVYRTLPEAAEKLRYAPMPDDKRQVVINQFINWGMLPREKVEAMVGPALPPVHATTTDVTPA